MIDVQGTSLTEEDRELLAHPLVGAVILFTRNFESVEQLQQLVADIRSIRTPPLLVTVDHEGGRVQRFRKGFTVLPSMRLIGREYDLDAQTGRQLARQCGWLMAAELRAIGIDMSFAPCVDLDYGVSTVIGDRAFHRDPRVVAELAIAFMGGMREAGMAATAKHFPGHGAVVPDSHVAMPVDRRALADLDDDIYPYRRLIDNGLASIMAAHVIFPRLMECLPGSPGDGYSRSCEDASVSSGLSSTDDLSDGGGVGRRRAPRTGRSGPGSGLRRAFAMQRSQRCAASHRFFARESRSFKSSAHGPSSRKAGAIQGDPVCLGRMAGLRSCH